MANDSTKVGDSVSASIMRGLSLGEGPLFSRKQQVFVEKFSGTPLYRLWDGREVSQDFFVNLNPDEVKEIRAKHPSDFDEQLSKMPTGVFVEPVNRVQAILSHNQVVNQGVYAIAEAVQLLIAGSGSRGSAVTINLDNTGNTANYDPVDYVPSGMLYGTSSAANTVPFNTPGATEMTDPSQTNTVTIEAAKTYDGTYPTVSNGQITLKSTFAAPGGSGVTGISCISQNVVTNDINTGATAGTHYVAGTATSIINLSTLLSLGASDTLAATVTWTIS